MDDFISRKTAIDLLKKWSDGYSYIEVETNSAIKAFEEMPSAQSEAYKEKLKEIADALSEKFVYMNTCLNERDIILGYLGVKRPSKIHCNTDCPNIKCESYRCDKRLPSAQPTQTNADPMQESALDCVRRQQAIDVLDVLCQEHRYRIPGKRETYSQYNEAWQDALGRAECAIGELPSAQPETPPPTTEWLGNHTPFRCKRCGHYSDTRTPYCAYCGKKANNYE